MQTKLIHGVPMYVGTRFRARVGVCLFALFVFLLTLPTAQAQTHLCEDLFPDGVQSNYKRGYVAFGFGAQLFGNPDLVLATPKVYQYRYYNPRYQPLSCDAARCEASGQATPYEQVQFDKFKGKNKLLSFPHIRIQFT